MNWKAILTSPVTLLAPLTCAMMLLFQNCAAPASSHTRETPSTDIFEVPMSKVLVHLNHDAGSALSEVEPYADDAVRAVKSDDAMTKQDDLATSLAIRLAVPPES